MLSKLEAEDAWQCRKSGLLCKPINTAIDAKLVKKIDRAVSDLAAVLQASYRPLTLLLLSVMVPIVEDKHPAIFLTISASHRKG